MKQTVMIGSSGSENLIYLDNAATGNPKPQSVIDAVEKALKTHGNPFRGAHEFSQTASVAVYAARKRVGRLFHVSPMRCAFTANITESLNIAATALTAHDHVVTTIFEHNSVLRPLVRSGCELTILKPDKDMAISLDEFKMAFKHNTKAVFCTHASNLTGDMLDIASIGKICRAHGVLFVADTAQTAGVFDIDAERDHIDVLCFTGHKALMGPQGTGGLYVRDGIELAPHKVGGGGVNTLDLTPTKEMPECFESGTMNSHSLAGLAAGLEFIEKTGLNTIYEHEKMLLQYFYEGIKDTHGVTIYGNFTRVRAPVIALNIGDASADIVSDLLATNHSIATRAGLHCAPLIHRYLGTEKRGAVRFSFSYFNTLDEIECTIKALSEIARHI